MDVLLLLRAFITATYTIHCWTGTMKFEGKKPYRMFAHFQKSEFNSEKHRLKIMCRHDSAINTWRDAVKMFHNDEQQ